MTSSACSTTTLKNLSNSKRKEYFSLLRRWLKDELSFEELDLRADGIFVLSDSPDFNSTFLLNFLDLSHPLVPDSSEHSKSSGLSLSKVRSLIALSLFEQDLEQCSTDDLQAVSELLLQRIQTIVLDILEAVLKLSRPHFRSLEGGICHSFRAQNVRSNEQTSQCRMPFASEPLSVDDLFDAIQIMGDEVVPNASLRTKLETLLLLKKKEDTPSSLPLNKI